MSKSISPQPLRSGPSTASNPSPVLSAAEAHGKYKYSAVKAASVFSNDGSFLDRIRCSIKDEDDKKKEQEALERKKNFADRFKIRGKRPPPPQSPPSNSDVTPERDETPKKKKKTSEEDKHEDKSAQAAYHKALDSYPSSLKDGGTGVRSLVK